MATSACAGTGNAGSTTTTGGRATSSSTTTTDTAEATTTTVEVGGVDPGTSTTTMVSGTALGEWKALASDRAEVRGNVTCSIEKRRLGMTFSIEGQTSTFDLTFDAMEGPGRFTARDGDVVQSEGTVTVAAEQGTAVVADREEATMTFSFNASFTLGESDRATLSGTGSCVLPGGVPPALEPPVADAERFARALVDVALASADGEEDDFGAAAAWEEAGLPRKARGGPTIEATDQRISTFAAAAVRKGRYRVLPFAVSDGDGCVFGWVFTNVTKIEGSVERTSARCTANQALDRFDDQH